MILEGKETPAVNDIESAVISVVLCYGETMRNVAPIIKPDDFFNQEFAHIYTACFELYSESMPIDIYNVSTRLKKLKLLERAGGSLKLMQLSNDASLDTNITSWAEIIKGASVKRQVIKLCSETMNEAFGDEVWPQDILKNIQSGIDNIHKGIFKQNERTMEQIALESLEAIVEDSKRKGVSATPFGLHEFDRKVSIDAPDFVVIGGRPGMCKTAFGLAAAKRQAQSGMPVGFISLEMSDIQLGKRLISMQAPIDIREYAKTGTPDDYKKMALAANDIGQLPFYICQDPSMTITDVVSTARKWRDKHKIGILYIDYLQLIGGDNAKDGNREQVISKISRRLKQLAKELHIPIVAFSQLSRPNSKGAVGRPILTDLRESGAIEQDADIVIFLHRWEYYGQMVDDEGKSTKDRLDMIIAKFRNGEVDRTAWGRYDKKTQNFYDWDSQDEISFPVEQNAGTSNIFKQKLISMDEAMDNRNRDDAETPF